MRTNSRKSWPLFLLFVAIGMLGAFVVGGTAGGVLTGVAAIGLLCTAVYAISGEKVQDGVGGIAGPF